MRLPLPSLAACLALLALAAPSRADTPLLFVDRQPGAARLNWTGGVADYTVYESAEARRVVSPARAATTTPSTEWIRTDGVSDTRVLFFQVGCPGGGCDETCFDGVDNDGDTAADCADADCAGTVDCVAETDCADGADDEGDDLVDCADPDCGRRCDDGLACTVDACDAAAPGACTNVAKDCDDLDPCTVDSCDPADGSCDNVPRACDDGDACNGLETCDPGTGACLPGTPVTCDDLDACDGLETCDPATGGCLPGTPVDCADTDLCTIDTCSPADGSCSNVPRTCDDLDACNGIETCDAGTGNCLPGTPVTCDDLDACNGLETCDPATGSCIPGSPVDCVDTDLCTVDTCDPADGSCSNTPVACDDLDACNGLETCDPGTGNCRPGTGVDCDDLDACTTDTCDPADGSCGNVAISCDDLDACTTDTCDAAIGCRNAPVSCDDLDPCTTDTCDPATGCDNPPLDCDDGVACTVDSCDPGRGCQNVPDPGAQVAVMAQLAGNQLAAFPFFEHARAFNRNADVEVAIDPFLFPDVAGRTCDVYVVAARTTGAWCTNGALVDVRGAPDTRTFTGTGIQANTFALVAPNQLSADAGASLGVGYDVVLDCDRDGQLDATDYLDGGAEAGLYEVHDLTQRGPVASNSFSETGPRANACAGIPPFDWSPEGDDWNVYYPAALDDPSFVGTFPMVVISHGNGHCWAMYDALQDHLTSYGYIVFSHDNNTVPGIETASSSTLFWTEKFIAEQATLAGGVYDGHLDTTRITWIGHSRGGEGVVRAYDRLFDGETRPSFTIGDIRLVVSMAPTDFLGLADSNPHDVRYNLIYGAADGDVNGCANSDVADSFNIYERGTGPKSSTYVHGANHTFFHDCDAGIDEGMGPARITCDEQHRVQHGSFLALLEHHVEGNVPGKDFLWRQYESIRPSGVAASTVVVNDFKDAAGAGFVIDDYQTNTTTGTSSSGGSVTSSVSNLVEDVANDGTGDFNASAGDAMNGMTRVNQPSGDTQRCAVFDYNSASTYELAIPAGQRDWRNAGYVSLRACQATRHARTTAVLADLTFRVTLVDGAGRTSSIGVGSYGGGIEEPYQRTLCGSTGAGWANEFEVVRIRLSDFLHDDTRLDLSDVRAVRLDLGGGAGSAEGRLGLDDVKLSPE